jgi:hypothetical protein
LNTTEVGSGLLSSVSRGGNRGLRTKSVPVAQVSRYEGARKFLSLCPSELDVSKSL